jgi:hypothetical protein
VVGEGETTHEGRVGEVLSCLDVTLGLEMAVAPGLGVELGRGSALLSDEDLQVLGPRGRGLEDAEAGCFRTDGLGGFLWWFGLRLGRFLL